MNKIIDAFNDKMKRYPRSYKVLYTKHSKHTLLLILLGSMLFSLLLTLSGCVTYVEPVRLAPVIYEPGPIVIVDTHYYGWHHGFHGRR